MKPQANTKIDGRSSFKASSFKPQDRISQERAPVNPEPPMYWIDVHCSWDLTRTEKSLDPGSDARVSHTLCST